VFCGTGQGDAMVANKVPGVRAALCWDTFTAALSRSHNDANMLVLEGRMVGQRLAQKIVKAWLDTSFSGGRHQRRVEQIAAIESQAHHNRLKVYDVTLPIHPAMIVYPGDAPVAIDTVKSIEQGGSCNVSLLHIGSHTGTHVDAPGHFIRGAAGVDDIGLDKLMGTARLFQLPGIHRISRQALAGLDLKGVTRLLLGTRSSALLDRSQVDTGSAYISDDAAVYLVELGLKLVGLDSLSVEEIHKEGHPAHHTLLDAGMVIIEGLDLAGVPAGNYELLCLPLKLKDGDGAPARVLLRKNKWPD
ncbi:MAG: RpiB/LacA/LacB family sugar-phosphate isomerase, partial [Dehalococcoidia bacterium]|nr:RpiB/LacA/LacB family sugar-phosphate isomerase [Dehalococcoidia bacterium]